jgi:hypothetical protein
MKICVIGFDRAVAEIVFQDERLSNLRRLMDAGLYGLVESSSSSEEDVWNHFLTSQNPVSSNSQSIWECLNQNGKKTILIEPVARDMNAPAMVAERWKIAKRQMADQPWDGFQFVDVGLNRASDPVVAEGVGSDGDEYLAFDEQIGSLMETMDDQTILLVLAPPSTSAGFFVLAAPNCPINGEQEGANLLDIAPTILDLAGYEVPSSMQGHSLVAGMEKLVPGDVDHDKILYDRLAGLGYV